MTDWEDEEDIYTCPACKTEDCVPPYGNKNSKVLLVGEFPGKDEIKYGRPFSGATGRVLRIELAKVGIDIKALRLCNLWYHLPNKSLECLNFGKKKVIEEASGKEAILLIGSDAVKEFCDMKVSEVSGLEVKSDYFSAPLVMACIQPANVFNNVVGDLRLSLQKFAKKAEKYL